MDFHATIELIGTIIDIAGVAVIVVGAIITTLIALNALLRRRGPVYVPFRRSLGRSILLGLELLVAADIIKTVALTPTMESVAVLGGIVLIRTFLSFSLELEISGRWPWQTKTPPQTPKPAPALAPTAEVLAPE
ncbi:DUF1622 domain-containing protein [Microterricola viridarii]|uniref:Uncharacterized membrane protein n=1 Tax=Microterricola viridarii TaxID=412690 RepID=A0A1H1W9T3_9MICO|nr:DUF1622 domain-containing protein [Microterricola viridarii]SDS93431.1 Uncharacterized membrane protein [Microterricola viridarii]